MQTNPLAGQHFGQSSSPRPRGQSPDGWVAGNVLRTPSRVLNSHSLVAIWRSTVSISTSRLFLRSKLYRGPSGPEAQLSFVGTPFGRHPFWSKVGNTASGQVTELVQWFRSAPHPQCRLPALVHIVRAPS
jgi:hypothetical protein